MAENKLRQLTAQEVYDNIDDYGTLSLGNATVGIPKDTQFIAKILEPVEEKFVEQLDKSVYTLAVEFKDNTCEPFQFKVRVSKSAIERMQKKHGEDYVGKRAFFSKASWKGKLVHHVNVILNESGGPSKPELVLKSNPVSTDAEDAEYDKKMDAMEEVMSGDAETTAVDHSLPKEKQPELPVSLNEWAKQFDNEVEGFKASFCNDGSYPETFVDWVQNATACGTDYFTKFEGEDLRREAAKTYFAMCHRLGL